MAVNNDFLGQITDALVNRTSEPGKLDDVAQKFGDIVRSLDKSVKSFDKMHAQMTAVFKEATRKASREPNAVPFSAQELTKITGKILQPLYLEIHALAHATSELNKAAVAQHKATQNFERETSARFARLQQKLETRTARAIASPAPSVDRTSLQAQLSRAFTDLYRNQRTFEQQMLAQFRTGVMEIQGEIRAKLKEQKRTGWSTPQIAMVEDLPATQYGAPSSGRRLDYHGVRNRALSDLDEWAVRQVIGRIEGGIEARAMHPAHSTRYGIKKGAGPAAESTPAYLGSAAIKLEHQFYELSRFLDHLKGAIGDVAAAKDLWRMVSFQKVHIQERRQQNLGKRTIPREEVMLGEDLTYATVAQVNSRIYHSTLPPSYWGSRREHANAQAVEKRLEPKIALARRIMAQSWSQPPKKSVYIAGPMRGIPELNFPAFDSAEEKWRKRGWGVVNPAQMDREHGYVPTKSQTVFKDLSIQQAMSRDLPAVAGTHAIALLPGWEKSQGAKMELQHAIERRKELYDAETGNRLKLKDVKAGLGEDVLRGAIAGRLPVSKLRSEPTTIFRSAEIDAFLGQHGKSPSGASIGPAAQMLNAGGISGHRAHELLNTVLGGWEANKNIRNAAAATASQDAYTKLLAAPSVVGSERASAQQPMSEAKRKGFEYAAKRRAGQRGFITADFLDFLNPFSKRGSKKPRDPGPSYPFNWWGGKEGGQPTPASRDYRAETRIDATFEKLKKLADAIGATENSFKHLNEVIAPQKLADVAARRGHVSNLASRRKEGINEAQKATESALGFSAIEAQTSLEFAQERALRTRTKLKGAEKIGGVSVASVAAREKISVGAARERMTAEIVDPMTALPGMKAAIAQFRASTAGLGLGEEEKISAARTLAAEQYAVARYGAGKGIDRKVPGKYTSAAADLQTQVEALLGGGQTSRQQADTKIGTIEADKEKALERLGAKEKKVRDDVAQAKIKSDQHVEDLKRTGRGVIEKHDKTEEMLAGRGASGTSAGKSGASAGKSGIGAGAQSGYGFGMGFMALVAYDDAMKNLVKDMAIYSARTEMMEMATNQMAKTSGLNVSQVDAEVEAIKRLNVTTQVAHQTVQRFMMMQIDVAKAAKMVAVAQDLAAISGADAMETVSRLSQAILTGYTRNLHMMGLQITTLGVMSDLKRDRKAAGKTGVISIQEQREALTSAILREGAKVAGTYERSMSTAGGQFAYLRKEAQETMNVLGKEFLPTFAQVMSSMTNGLKTIQGNAEGFADLAKAMVSVGVAASAVGTAGFLIQGVKALGLANPWALAAIAAIGGGTYAYLDRDKSEAYKGVAGQQNARFADLRKSARAERDALAAIKNPSVEQKKQLENAKEKLYSYDRQQNASAIDLKAHLAEDAGNRLNALDEYIASMSGDRGILSQAWSTVKGTPEQSIFGKIWSNLPLLGDTGAQGIDLARSQRAGLLAHIAKNSGFTPGAIARTAQQQREDAERARAVAGLGDVIVNVQKQIATSFASSMAIDEQAIGKIEAGLDPVTGEITRKARKMLGTPRQKAQIDYEFREASLAHRYKELGETMALKKRGEGGDVVAQSQYEKNMIALGGTVAAGEAKAQAALDEGNNAHKENVDVLSSELGNVAKQTDVRIAQIKEQTQVSRILGAVISGNYKSELEAIDKVLAKKKEDIKLGKTVKEDPDAARGARVAAEEEAQQSKDSLLKRFTSGIAEQERTESQYQAEVQARGIMEAPGADSLEATAQAYDARIAENEANELENNRKSSERRRLQHEKQDALHQIQLRRAGMAAQGNVTTFENAQRVAAAMAGSSEFDPMFGKRTELEQGKVSIGLRLSQGLDVAQYAYDQARSTPGVDMDEAERSRSQAVAAARTEAQESAIKFGGESRQSAGERLLDRYKQSLKIQEQIKHGMATSEAEDRAATANMHELRLSNIADETAARIKGGMSVQAAERVAAQERLEEESSKLQEMLAARRKQADAVKSFGSEFFMTAVTDHARGLRDMLMGKIKGTGAAMAGNALKMLVGTSPLMHLPNKMLVNSEGKPTKLGELLSGTMLGTPVASEKEVQEQLAKVTDLNSAATRENTTALDKLSDVAISIMQHLGIAYTPAPGFSPSAGGSGYTLRSGGVPASWGGGGGAFSYTPVPMGFGGGAAAPGGEHAVSSVSYNTEGVPPYILPYDGSFAGSGGAPMSGGGVNAPADAGVNAPADAAVAAQRLQQVLSTPGLAGAARATHTSGLLNMIKTVPGIMKLIPALKTLGGGKVPTVDLKTMEDLGVATPQGASIAAPGPVATAWQTAMSDVQGAAMIGTGAYQAATMMGKGARGDLFAAGGMAQAGAGAAQLFASELGPIAPGVQAGMEVASLVAEMLGSMFMDPKQKRSNQIANYLGMLQYMAPAQIAMTSSLAGNMVSEGKGGGATDTGIASTALKVTQPYMEQINPNPSFWSQPGAYLLGSNRPDVTQVPGLPSGMFPSADSLGGSQQYDYAGVPGQVLYNDLPGNAVPTNYGTMNVNISALDSKSVIDRAPDIAAAIQQQLRMGGSLAASLQSAVFGVG